MAMAAAAALLIVSLTAAGWTADSRGRDEMVAGARKIGQGIEQTAKGLGTTVTDGAKQVATQFTGDRRDARSVGDRLHDSAKGFGEALWDGVKFLGGGKDGKAVGDRLHDSAKGFGEALWDGAKYVGHTMKSFFTAKD